MSQVAHQAGAYPGFCSMKRLGDFYSLMDGIIVDRRVTPSIKFTGTHLYAWEERGIVRVKCLSQLNTTQCPRPEFEHGPLELESSVLIMRPPRLYPSE